MHPSIASLGIAITLSLGLSLEAEPSDFDHTHAALTGILELGVRDGGVDYAALGKKRAELDAYRVGLHARTPKELAGWESEERLAFWINLYNASILEAVLAKYPIESINDLSKKDDSIWDRPIIPMPAHHPGDKKRSLSLNNVENDIVRPLFEDPRIHAALNCAAASCPPLQAEAFVAEHLDAQLEAAMRSFVNDPLRNRYEAKKGAAGLSKIFDWFASDFVDAEGSVKAFIQKYIKGDGKWLRTARIEFLEYSWELNDRKQP